MGAKDTMYQALSIIKGEHRSIAAVLHGMKYLMRVAGERAAPPDFQVLRAMLYYLDTFPEKLHHPKEDKYLFRLLRERTAEETAVLNVLEHQHAQGESKIRALEQALIRYEAGGAQWSEAFAQMVEDYAEFHWKHMRFEEDIVMPLAERVLTEADWRQIAEAFGANGDPMFSASHEDEFKSLFTRIVTLAPPPIGVGPAAR